MSRQARTVRIDRPRRQDGGPVVALEDLEQVVTFVLAGIGRLPEPNRGDERLASVIADLASATQELFDPSPPLNNDRSRHT